MGDVVATNKRVFDSPTACPILSFQLTQDRLFRPVLPSLRFHDPTNAGVRETRGNPMARMDWRRWCSVQKLIYRVGAR